MIIKSIEELKQYFTDTQEITCDIIINKDILLYGIGDLLFDKAVCFDDDNEQMIICECETLQANIPYSHFDYAEFIADAKSVADVDLHIYIK